MIKVQNRRMFKWIRVFESHPIGIVGRMAMFLKAFGAGKLFVKIKQVGCTGIFSYDVLQRIGFFLQSFQPIVADQFQKLFPARRFDRHSQIHSIRFVLFIIIVMVMVGYEK
eukprot:Lithocolla_globosa_v1_NODE_12454_length_434_cov_1.828496.p2 type:complete len:111 gc:universal NODE_12454_length_434_cov_1.828496:54-386(+)